MKKLTTAFGAPVDDNQNIATAGEPTGVTMVCRANSCAINSRTPRSGSFRGRGMPADLIPGKEGEEASSRTSRGGDHERDS